MGYGYEKKKTLFLKGKKFYDMGAQYGDFIGDFTKAFPLNEVEYRKRKLQALSDASESDESPMLVKTRLQRDALLRLLNVDMGVSATKISLEMSRYCRGNQLSRPVISGILAGDPVE